LVVQIRRDVRPSPALSEAAADVAAGRRNRMQRSRHDECIARFSAESPTAFDAFAAPDMRMLTRIVVSRNSFAGTRLDGRAIETGVAP
jgi:hypothetical protein